MPKLTHPSLLAGIALLLFSTTAPAADTCQGFGPQAPRNIDDRAGENSVTFPFAPDFKEINLCNIHFHQPAEHWANDFSQPIRYGYSGEGGLVCNMARDLTEAEQDDDGPVCTNVTAGMTIEVHWVYTSCDVSPGPGLEACSSAACANPTLRVEAQVFLVVNDPSAANFADFAYGGNIVNGKHQAKSLPSDTGTPVRFLGSTTGPKFSQETCSPLQVSWSVRPQCAKLDIGSLATWCKENVFGEHHGHDVRDLVRDPKLLSKID